MPMDTEALPLGGCLARDVVEAVSNERPRHPFANQQLSQVLAGCPADRDRATISIGVLALASDGAPLNKLLQLRGGLSSCRPPVLAGLGQLWRINAP